MRERIGIDGPSLQPDSHCREIVVGFKRIVGIASIAALRPRKRLGQSGKYLVIFRQQGAYVRRFDIRTIVPVENLRGVITEIACRVRRSTTAWPEPFGDFAQVFGISGKPIDEFDCVFALDALKVAVPVAADIGDALVQIHSAFHAHLGQGRQRTSREFCRQNVL